MIKSIERFKNTWTRTHLSCAFIMILLHSLFFGVGTQARAFASDLNSEVKKIVVLIGLEDPESILPWKQVNNIVVNKFRQAFERSLYDLLIVPNATQVELAYYLNDSYTVAVFYISHSAAGSKNNSRFGIKPAPLILDSKGHNVINVFKKYSDNLKLVALVGCHSSFALRELINNNNSLNATRFNSPTFISIDQKIEFREGVQLAIDQSLDILRPEQLQINNSLQSRDRARDRARDRDNATLMLTFTRKSDNENRLLTSLQIEVNKTFVQVIPELKSNQEQIAYIQIPKSILTQKNKIKISSGYPLSFPDKNNVGSYQLKANDPNWGLRKFYLSEPTSVNNVDEEVFYLEFTKTQHE